MDEWNARKKERKTIIMRKNVQQYTIKEWTDKSGNANASGRVGLRSCQQREEDEHDGYTLRVQTGPTDQSLSL